ncbi:hypothetical protein ACA910_014739 [Epithemia clementina (nom. ined.)]
MFSAVLRQLTTPIKIADASAQALRLNVGRHTMHTPVCKNTNKYHVDDMIFPCKQIKLEVVQPQEMDISKLSFTIQSIVRMQNFSLSNYDVETTAAEKATKRDDAEAPEHLWNYRIAYLLGTKTLDATGH